jgi:hypothetical protein
MIGLRGRIPVEPLDDERLTNIERRIVAGAAEAVATPRRAPRFGVALAFAAAAAVVAIGAGFAGWTLRGDGATTAHTTVVAAEPVRVHTEADRSVLDIGDARITVDPATDFTITRPDGGVLVAMKRGKVELDVDKRTGRAPFVVAAGDTRVIVVGTRFSVDYGDGTGDVIVRVTEGVVRVERHQQEVRVAASQGWTTTRGVLALAEIPAAVIASSEAPADSKIDDKIEIDVDAPDVLKDRTPNVPDAKLPPVHHGSSAPRPTKPDVIVRPRPEPAGGSAAVDLRKQVLKQPLLAPIATTKRPEEAIGEYSAIMRNKKGVEHAHALYSMAWMQHMKLGRNGDALRSIDAVARGFQGRTQYRAIYHAALWLRVRILCTKGKIDDACRQAAYTYKHEASETSAAAVAELLTLAPR